MVQSIPGKAASAGFADYVASAKGAALNPLGHPNDIANLVLYLASDESRFFSGQRLIIDNTATVTMGAVPGVGSVADRIAQG